MAVITHELKDEKILVTGGQGPSGLPPARLLAHDNEVHVMARFTNPAVEDKLRALGIHCLKHDLLDSFHDIPDDFTYVWHSGIPARRQPGMWPNTFDHEGDAAGRLAYHCRNAKGFALVSSASSYEPPPYGVTIKEDNPLGHHGTKLGSFSKVAAEASATLISRQFGLPLSILRMGSPYGPDGGLPVERLISIVKGDPVKLHPEKPLFRPHWDSDLARMAVNSMVEARNPPLIINFCGDDIVGAHEYCAFFGELLGIEPNIVYSPDGATSLIPDTTFMHEVLGECEVGWQEGCRRLVEAKVWESGYTRDYGGVKNPTL